MSDTLKRIIPIYLVLILYIFINILFSFTTLLSSYSCYLNPIFLILISILVFSLTKGFKLRNRNKYYKNIILFIIIYFIIYYLSGLVFGYISNSFLLSISDFFKNIFIFILVILLKEYIRYRLISISKKKSSLILITILFILLDINYTFIFSDFINYFFSDIISIVILNINSSYLIYKVNYKTNFIYRGILAGIMFLLPVIPNYEWYVLALFLLIFLIGVNLLVDKFSILERRRERKRDNPIISGIFCFGAIVFILFMFGFFKYQPIAILSNSMKDYYSKGDAVVIEKIDKEDIPFIEKNDIIYYRYDNKYITHRVYDIKIINDSYVFYTKGDNNEFVDNWVVNEDDVIGVVQFRLKYLGWPSVLLNELLA